MLARPACRRGRCFAPNAASYASKAWGAPGLVQRRQISAINAISSVLSPNSTSRRVAVLDSRSLVAIPRWLDSRRHFWKSSSGPKDDNVDNPFNAEEANSKLEEYMRSMGGNSRQIRNLLDQFDDAMKEKSQLEDEDKVGPYDDVDEEIDPWEQDPNEEPAYKTVYLPADQLDQMMASGFLKPLHEIDPLEDEELGSDVRNLPEGAKWFLKKFFMRMQLAKAHPSSTIINSCWRQFRIVYKHPEMAKVFNEDAWAVLWGLDKDPIPSHRKIWLGDLMAHVGAELTEAQWISYVEALFWHEQRDKAFKIWSLGADSNPSMLWWALGARLHATENQPLAAMNIIDTVIRTQGKAIPKLFLPTIICYHTMAEASRMQNLKDKEVRYNQQAVLAYNKMKMYCSNIQPKEYMRVALSFLEAGYFIDALKVYEDALTVHTHMIDDQATASYWEWKFKRATIKAQNDPSLGDDELQDLTVSALRLLPQKDRSRIILGNWMRNLIRRNKIEEALKIARFMQSLGMQMDTTTYNLFIMLLAEHGKIGMLETLAARMIRKLLEPMFRHNATFEQVLHEPGFQPIEPASLDLSNANDNQLIRSRTDSDVQLPEDVEEILARFEQKPLMQLPVVNEIRPKPLSGLAQQVFTDLIKYHDLIPPADPATFGLLLRQSTRSNNVLKTTSLITLFQKAKIRPNAKLLNPVLMMLARHSTIEKLFATHRLFVSSDGFDSEPNTHTYQILWSSLTKALKKKEDLPDGVLGPRKLFEEMVNHSGSVELNQNVYDNVLRAFWAGWDPVGAYTAMNGMAMVWEKLPIRQDLHITIAGISRLLTRGLIHFARRHNIWYMKKLAHDQFGNWVSPNPVRRKVNMVFKCWTRNLRRKYKLRQAVEHVKVNGGDPSKLLEELKVLVTTLSKQQQQLQKYEAGLKKYWEEPPIGLKLPRTDEARAAVSGAIPIDLDRGGDDYLMPDSTINEISKFIRQRLFDGPWPQKWLDEVVLARGEMGLVDEEAIQSRKMSMFDIDDE
ncbi:hypothetical protein H072_4071 [Dactylellina haptotyla CBS 200.50]|uniref:Pentacotripeptide-repeat region of PRORP domain-containing protein n=1 Tax=Dactylellina haptotyla (strain CBS 200.50) TaxID=1284197 RepID=S8ALJ1_DACHA|nr:hypothetical protein H072_4071 [Dactylellina haptotyla CBS 200.50]